MGPRGTLVLALLLAAALAYAWVDVASDAPGNVWEAVLDSRPTPPGEAVERLLSFDPSAITSVRIRQGDAIAEATRTEAGWRPADPRDAVEDLLQALAELAEILVLDTGAGELADYGLDPPDAAVELGRRGEAPVVLLIGQRNPTATAVYARVGPNGPVVLTGAIVLWEIDKAVKALGQPG